MLKALSLPTVKKQSIYIFSLFLVIATGFSSCKESYQKILKSNDLEYKYRKAKEYYDKEKYQKALPIFEELITLYKGTKSIDEYYYLYAMCHFEQASYLIAAFHFKNIYDSYPFSPYAEECLYRNALCYDKMSPKISLDQSNTQKAIEYYQLFVNSYPETEKMELCNQAIKRLHRKLEVKDFNSAELYYRTFHYKAAAVAFENLLEKYPDTQDAEKIQLYIVKSYYEYAKRSIQTKQLERYNFALDAYKKFKKQYPNSSLIAEATKFQEAALKDIEESKLEKN